MPHDRWVRIGPPPAAAGGLNRSATLTDAVGVADLPSPALAQGGGTVTHGSQLTRAMCGPRVALTTVAGSVSASDFGASGVTISGKRFTGTFHPDVNCTLVDCWFDQPVDNATNKAVQMNYCTVSPATPGDWTIGPQGISATRCVLEGCSDGIRWSGSDIVECWVRTKLQSQADHNDGLQAYQAGAGGSLLRNNIDCRPVNGTGDNSTTTAAIFIADASEGTAVIRDNYLAGGNGVLRLHENMFYRVTGNIIENNSWSSGTGPVSTSNSRAGAFLEWSNNTLTTGAVLTP